MNCLSNSENSVLNRFVRCWLNSMLGFHKMRWYKPYGFSSKMALMEVMTSDKDHRNNYCTYILQSGFFLFFFFFFLKISCRVLEIVKNNKCRYCNKNVCKSRLLRKVLIFFFFLWEEKKTNLIEQVVIFCLTMKKLHKS